MRKTLKSVSKSKSETTALPVDITADIEKFQYKLIEITSGKKFPIGTKLECNRVGIKNGFKKPYLMVIEPGTGEYKFVGIDDAKVIKALSPARAAVLQAENEANADDTTLFPLDVRQESAKAVLAKYSAWFTYRWIPKRYLEKVCDTSEGLTIFEFTTWKLKLVVGDQDAWNAVESKQDAWRKQSEEILNPKPTLIKKADMVKPFLNKRNSK